MWLPPFSVWASCKSIPSALSLAAPIWCCSAAWVIISPNGWNRRWPVDRCSSTGHMKPAFYPLKILACCDIVCCSRRVWAGSIPKSGCRTIAPQLMHCCNILKPLAPYVRRILAPRRKVTAVGGIGSRKSGISRSCLPPANLWWLSDATSTAFMILRKG
ncbi:hypothetical protein D3C72_1642770 [compost metagenome]